VILVALATTFCELVLNKKGPRCQICEHSDRWRIELLRAGGASLDSLAEKFGVSRDAIHRHWTRHVTDDAKASYLAGPSQMEALHAKAAAEGESVVDYFRIVRTALMASLTACSEAGDARGVALVANTLISTLEKIGKITGEIANLAGNINVTNNIAIVNSPIFARLQAAQLRALAAYPEARAATVAAWRELDLEMADAPAKLPNVIEHVPALPLCPIGLP
jgi:hypothetical protein